MKKPELYTEEEIVNAAVKVVSILAAAISLQGQDVPNKTLTDRAGKVEAYLKGDK